ncbi:MAG: MAE_28990/MAE_18760 family HEPN-like nuclease [Thermoflexibacteraceae bacterium]|jgi:hypothetical protein
MTLKDNLLESITIENKWRETDFANMKRIYENLSSSNDLQKMFLRMCVPYIYAHWEGYAMSSLKLLLGFLNDLQLSYNDVTVNLFVLSLGDKFSFLKGKQSFEQRCEFSNNFLSTLSNKELKFDKKSISSKSNLNADVLEELCQIFGFNFNNFSNYTTGLNQLVNIRNHIAHGENGYKLDLDKLGNYMELVTNLNLILFTEIKRFIEEENYKKN